MRSPRTASSRGLGIATLNALAELCWRRRPHPGVELLAGTDAFDATQFHASDRVVLVGAFIPFLKELKRRHQPYLVLEQNPDALKPEEMAFYRPADAAPEIVPLADVLLITGATLINDTLEDLLLLARPEARVTVLGPTVGMLPDAFLARGADILGSVRITAPDAFLDLLAEGGSAPHFLGHSAEKIVLAKKAVATARVAWTEKTVIPSQAGTHRSSNLASNGSRPSPNEAREAAMAERLGGGEWSFEVNEDWAKIPDEITLGDCAAVGVDSKDNVYAFNRGDHPVAVFDKDGNLLRTWGEGVFTRPHGVHVAPDDTIWLTDDGDHTVRHCTLDGKVLMTLGVPGKPAPFMSGEPFHRCTHTALSPQCDHVFVSDGYGNARIHRYSIDGKLEKSWGESGTDPGQFNIAHNICCDPQGWVYLADRENHRVQVFDGNGKYETQWNNLHRPNGMCLGPNGGHGTDPLCYIGEGGPAGEINKDWPNIGARVSIHTLKGKVVARLGKPHGGMLPGQFTSPHGIAVDSHGNIFVGELTGRSWSRFSKDPMPKKLRVIHKLAKVAA